jgi:hypothetical protein
MGWFRLPILWEVAAVAVIVFRVFRVLESQERLLIMPDTHTLPSPGIKRAVGQSS